jgi:ATP-dependent Clp protease ATP-binding subunit ClpA
VCVTGSTRRPRPPLEEVRRWSGWARAADHARARGCRRVGTEHLLLALVDGPPGPARDALSAAGVIPGTVRRSLEAIAGPNAAVSQPVEPACVEPGDRAVPVLVRATASARCPHRGTADGPQGRAVIEDVHVLEALIIQDEDNLARLVLRQLRAVRAIERGLHRSGSAPS